MVAAYYAYVNFLQGDMVMFCADLAVATALLTAPIVGRLVGSLEKVVLVILTACWLVFALTVHRELPEDISSLAWLSMVPASYSILLGTKGFIFSLTFIVVHAGAVVYTGKLNTPYLMDIYVSYAVLSLVFLFLSWMSERYMSAWSLYSDTDSLTGVLNRRAFEKRLKEELERSKRYDLSLSLIIIDIDDFKRINDTLGHLVGDRVLKLISGVINLNIRDTDVLARWGGEEFVVMLPNTNIGGAVALAEKLCSNIRSYSAKDMPDITTSIGVAQLREMDTPNTLLDRADKAMYVAKKEGKDRVRSNL